MNIALSTSVIQRGRTGIGQYVLALVRALVELPLPHRLHLLVLESDLPLFDFARERACLVPVPEAHRSAVRDILWHQRVLPRLARQQGWDLIHVPSYRRLLWSQACTTTGTIHDLAPFHVRRKYDPLRMFYGRVVVRHLARRQRRIVTVSAHTASDVRRYFDIPDNRLRVIHNGLDHSRFHPGDVRKAREEVRLRFGLDQPFLLFVSRLEHPAKNHVRLIEAYDQFRDRTGLECLLVLAGGDWHGADVIRSAAAASRHARDIRLPGFVPDARLPDLYRAATALVYPSLHEGFGMPPVEAMACGCPVISSTRGALGEVVGTAAAVVDPEVPADIADAMVRVVTDSAFRQCLIDAGTTHAARFSWERCATETVRVWEEAVAPSHGPRA